MRRLLLLLLLSVLLLPHAAPAQVESIGGSSAVRQESTTAGQSGPLVQCAVTTSAPTYTTGKTDPLSCTTTGGLRISGTVTATGSLTDAELRATPVPISGTVTVTDGAGALNVIVDSAPTTAVTAASLPLPTGAATSALQDGIIKDGAGDTTQANVSSGRIHVDPSGVTSPISAASLPLPSGASTSALQGGGLPVALGAGGGLKVDGSGTALPISGTVTVTDGAGALNVIVDSGTVTVTDGAGALNVICDSGCSGGTQYNQGTAGTSTDTLTMAGAIRKDTAAVDAGVVDGDRVVLSTDSVGRLRVTAADTTQPVSGTFWQATQPVSGTVTVTDGAGALNVIVDSGTTTVTQATGTNLHVVVDSAPTTAVTGTFWQATQPVSEASPASRAVTNAGTFATQAAATLTAETTKVIGTVRAQGNLGAAFDAATGAAPPANAVLAGGLVSGATGGFLGPIPISDAVAVVNISTITTTLIVTGVAGRHVRIGALNLVTAAANNVAFLSGTGATCGTGTAGMSGGTTAASGYNFAANGGIAQGSGLGTIMKTVATGDSVCIITSATTQLSGSVSYTIY